MQLNKDHGWTIDWSRFLVDWLDAHVNEIEQVRTGELPWMNLDEIHRRGLAERFTVTGVRSGFLFHRGPGSDRENLASLAPLGGYASGTRAIASAVFSAGTLSNGNVALLEQMALNENLPWDYIFSADRFVITSPTLKPIKCRHNRFSWPHPKSCWLPPTAMTLPPPQTRD